MAPPLAFAFPDLAILRRSRRAHGRAEEHTTELFRVLSETDAELRVSMHLFARACLFSRAAVASGHAVVLARSVKVQLIARQRRFVHMADAALGLTRAASQCPSLASTAVLRSLRSVKVVSLSTGGDERGEIGIWSRALRERERERERDSSV